MGRSRLLNFRSSEPDAWRTSAARGGAVTDETGFFKKGGRCAGVSSPSSCCRPRPTLPSGPMATGGGSTRGWPTTATAASTGKGNHDINR